MSSSVALVIPARLGSTRLPRKVLLPWQGEAIIAHVAKRAVKAHLGPVYIACDSPEVEKAVAHLPVTCIQTDPNLQKGTDRVYAAMASLKASYDVVVNIQGDLPNLTTEMIEGAINGAAHADIGTVAAPITNPEEIHSPAVVKIAMTPQGRALYFSRNAIPYGASSFFHHIGIYAYRAAALKRYVSLPMSHLEKYENLEQLRAMEDGMTIHVNQVSTIPISIDTPQDYEKLQKFQG